VHELLLWLCRYFDINSGAIDASAIKVILKSSMEMVLKYILLLCAVHQAAARSYGLKRDSICEYVDTNTIKVIDDPDSCGKYVACVGQVAYHFKCFSDGVYGNSTAICLSCDEFNEYDSFYEDDDERYGGTKRTTKKKFTYRQTKRTSSKPKRYGPPTKPPRTYSLPPATTVSEEVTTEVNDFTIIFNSELHESNW